MIIHMKPFIDKKFMEKRNQAYEKLLNEMPKQDALEEMTRYVEKKQSNPNFLNSEENVLRGIILFNVLKNSSETQELMNLCLYQLKLLKNKLEEIKNANAISSTA